MDPMRPFVRSWSRETAQISIGLFLEMLNTDMAHNMAYEINNAGYKVNNYLQMQWNPIKSCANEVLPE